MPRRPISLKWRERGRGRARESERERGRRKDRERIDMLKKNAKPILAVRYAHLSDETIKKTQEVIIIESEEWLTLGEGRDSIGLEHVGDF